MSVASWLCVPWWTPSNSFEFDRSSMGSMATATDFETTMRVITWGSFWKWWEFLRRNGHHGWFKVRGFLARWCVTGHCLQQWQQRSDLESSKHGTLEKMSNSWWYLELFAEEFYHVLPPKNSPVVMDDHDISYRAAMVPWRFPMFFTWLNPWWVE